MDAEQTIQAEARYLVPTYSRPPVVFTRGEGSHLFDSDGKRYIDFAAGIAVTAIGHSHPNWVAALHQQSQALTHISNLYHSAPHVDLARRLVDHSFADRIFFSNSGAEANEAALKFARKWAHVNHESKKREIVAFEGGFHGRTLGALSLTHKPAYRHPFEPLMPGVSFAPFNDLAAAERVITDRVCAVFVEPIQGEGGVHPADAEFLRGLRKLCDQSDVLLVFDEIQCGLGRTGRLWAHEVYEIRPDIMTLAKPLAGGLPIGVTLVTEEVSREIDIGDHGSTFGAGPLVCRAAPTIFDQIRKEEFLAEVVKKGAAVKEGLSTLPVDQVVEVRGSGLLIGVQFKEPVKPIIEAAFEKGLMVINAGENTLRICPALTISVDEIEEGIEILADSVAEVYARDRR